MSEIVGTTLHAFAMLQHSVGGNKPNSFIRKEAFVEVQQLVGLLVNRLIFVE